MHCGSAVVPADTWRSSVRARVDPEWYYTRLMLWRCTVLCHSCKHRVVKSELTADCRHLCETLIVQGSTNPARNLMSPAWALPDTRSVPRRSVLVSNFPITVEKLRDERGALRLWNCPCVIVALDTRFRSLNNDIIRRLQAGFISQLD